ncbi:hypothetical protein IFM89_031463 [Coptis chinensis]|uniref:RNase H type-1 domain-containing protein n=1 Tax=Coptis chinensis TaxID=261450 RepID=A0A835LL07_9MAGN|nr:hypothetical protein IFM89_031463 [Coptis chinensis]
MKCRSPLVMHIWTAAVVGGMVALLRHRNLMVSYNCVQDNELLAKWNVSARLRRAPRTTICIWLPPAPDQNKISIDGAARGNRGPSDYGIAVRNYMGGFLEEGSIHWKLRGRFEISKNRFSRLCISHTMRVANIFADLAAKCI